MHRSITKLFVGSVALLLSTLSVGAQSDANMQSATFDFSNPETLSPRILLSEFDLSGSGPSKIYDLADIEFNSAPFALSTAPQQDKSPTDIAKLYYDANKDIVSFRLYYQTQLTIAADSKVCIKSITFTHGATRRLALAQGQSGTLTEGENSTQIYTPADKVSTVVFEHPNSPTSFIAISKIEISYTIDEFLGIDLQMDGEGSTPRYYDLNGRPISSAVHPLPGVYIRRTDQAIEKVIIK